MPRKSTMKGFWVMYKPSAKGKYPSVKLPQAFKTRERAKKYIGITKKRGEGYKIVFGKRTVQKRLKGKYW